MGKHFWSRYISLRKFSGMSLDITEAVKNQSPVEFYEKPNTKELFGFRIEILTKTGIFFGRVYINYYTV